MLRFVHRFMLVLIAFAIVGGTSVQLAQSAQYVAPVTMAGMPCDMMMPMADAGHGKPMLPCKGLTPDCIKQMGCLVAVALPARPAGTEFAVPFSMVDYWPAWSAMAGADRTPEPLPPRTT
jgi:hypothetical protein